jgi:hypothetical protein
VDDQPLLTDLHDLQLLAASRMRTPCMLRPLLRWLGRGANIVRGMLRAHWDRRPRCPFRSLGWGIVTQGAEEQDSLEPARALVRARLGHPAFGDQQA